MLGIPVKIKSKINSSKEIKREFLNNIFCLFSPFNMLKEAEEAYTSGAEILANLIYGPRSVLE
jgi:hypothetical protein